MNSDNHNNHHAAAREIEKRRSWLECVFVCVLVLCLSVFERSSSGNIVEPVCVLSSFFFFVFVFVLMLSVLAALAYLERPSLHNLLLASLALANQARPTENSTILEEFHSTRTVTLSL